MTPVWRVGRGRTLSLDRPRILAIINVTPDSFSDGGRLATPDLAARAMQNAVSNGADMLDVGGESTRPGAQRIDPQEQIHRVVPAIREARARGVACPISVDTTSARVARAAIDAGADAINDVSAGIEDPDMLPFAAETRAGLILMHRLRPPGADVYSHEYAQAPAYDASAGGVWGVVREFLEKRAAVAMDAGVDHSAIVLDPGLGFGKSVEQNWILVQRLSTLASLGFAVISAASRKSFIGEATGVVDPAARIAGSVAVSVAHALAGVRLFRVHDVAQHAQALRVAQRCTTIE